MDSKGNTIHSVNPRVINVDKNAVYPPAMDALKVHVRVDEACKLRRVKYLNNIFEQGHRFIKRRGYEAMNMIRKGQVDGVEKEDITGQVKFIESLFGIAA